MTKFLFIIVLMVSFSFVSFVYGQEDYDFFGEIWDFFGFGDSEDFSYENANLTSKFYNFAF